MGFVIAIDGPAGTGKGSVSKELSEKLNFMVMDTGAMYRCITVYLIENNIKIDEIEKIADCLSKIKIDMKEIDSNMRFFLNDIDVSEKIRTKEVDNLVSQVSHIPEVRSAMVNLQRKLSKGKNVILEGRDIGTVVFPNADVKIYLDASPEERARRRFKQNIEKGINISYEEVLENVKFRDENDKSSKVSPLKKADDAVYVDSTNLSIEQVVEQIENIVKLKRGNV